ncbi:AAA family ATPase [Stakelama pacifica]|uniref:Pilus assembly protein CpaE n=1 Tax=Stakelama pacifica TaxID=517720 RepID=A0A4R6FQ69_9SPHN|nr:pilus assembly protein CpaE [Stakelama pacifica]TDN83732.1 pilus assembly protein CpaE [Stakelama pacifica]GGO94663.1 hypothetical protein GCM10011329_17070 [Stakelama pacifica]
MNAPWRSGRSGQRETFAAFVSDDHSLDVLRACAGESGWAPERAVKGGLREAIRELSVSASPNILFIDLSDSADPISDIHALAEVCEPGTVVITAGQRNDVRLYRELLASGIHDYLLKPLLPDLVNESLAQAQAILAGPRAESQGPENPHCAIAVVGTRGGVGASTVTTSLGWLISERRGRTTGILDLDLHFGTAALSLDLDPGRGLTDAIENPSRIDGLFIERAMVRANERLAILSAESPLAAPILTDGTAFFQLEEELRGAFECTLVDIPRDMLIRHPHLVSEMQHAVIVTEFTLAAARDTIRLLSWFKTNAPHCAILIVANRVHPASLLEISRKDFETSIERSVDHIVPFDQKLAAQAAKLGKSIAETGGRSKTVAPLLALAEQVSSVEDDAAGRKKTGNEGSLLDKLSVLTMRKPGGPNRK